MIEEKPLSEKLNKYIIERGRAKYPAPRFGKDNPMFGKVGPLNPFYGKKHTKESREKISAAKTKLRDVMSTGEPRAEFLELAK